MATKPTVDLLKQPLSNEKGWHQVMFWAKLPNIAGISINLDGEITIQNISDLRVLDEHGNTVLRIPLQQIKKDTP